MGIIGGLDFIHPHQNILLGVGVYKTEGGGA